jgi:polar amino acid transport system permease protein
MLGDTGIAIVAQVQAWDWGFIPEIMPPLLRGLRITVQATLVGTAVAWVIGLVMALLRMSPIRVVRLAMGFVIEFLRSTPLLVQLFFAFFTQPILGVRLSAFTTGVIVIGLHFGAYCSEVYRAGINAIAKGQWEAARALNFSGRHTWQKIILPQSIPPMVPALTNYLIAMYKDTPMLLAIGVPEVLLQAREICSATFKCTEPLTMVGVLFFLVSYPSALLLRRVEARFARAS